MNRVSQLEKLLWESCETCVNPAHISLVQQDFNSIKVSLPKLEFTDFCFALWETDGKKGWASSSSDFILSINDLPDNSTVKVKAAYRCKSETISRWSTFTEEFTFQTKEKEVIEDICKDSCNIHGVSLCLKPIWEAIHNGGSAEITWAMRPEGHGKMLDHNPDFDPQQPIGPGNWQFIQIPSISWDQPTITTAQWHEELHKVFEQFEVLFKTIFGKDIQFTEIDNIDNANIKIEQTQSLTNSVTLATAGPTKRTKNGVTEHYVQVRFFLNKKWEVDCGNQSGAYSVQYVGAHELAHAFGLAHGVCYNAVDSENYKIMSSTASSGNDLCDYPYSGELMNDLYIKECIHSVFNDLNLEFL